VKERHPHAVPFGAAHREDAEVAAGELEDGVPGRWHVGAVGHQRPDVLDRELVREIVAAPAHCVEGVRGVHAPRVDILHLRDDLEAAGLAARVERAGSDSRSGGA
jgi:hypothetical protein